MKGIQNCSLTFPSIYIIYLFFFSKVYHVCSISCLTPPKQHSCCLVIARQNSLATTWSTCSQMLYVWNIYLHLPYISAKCRVKSWFSIYFPYIYHKYSSPIRRIYWFSSPPRVKRRTSRPWTARPWCRRPRHVPNPKDPWSPSVSVACWYGWPSKKNGKFPPKSSIGSQMLNGTGIFTYIWVVLEANVG